MPSIAQHRTVYAIDMLGFGRSTRVNFSSNATVAEMEIVESVEGWRKALGLDTFILAGHCFGGYIATSYAIRYPSRVRHLMLIDPWGFTERPLKSPDDEKRRLPRSYWVRCASLLIQPINPFAVLRLAGRYGYCFNFSLKSCLSLLFDSLSSYLLSFVTLV